MRRTHTVSEETRKPRTSLRTKTKQPMTRGLNCVTVSNKKKKTKTNDPHETKNERQ